MSSLLDETIEAVASGLSTAVYQRPVTPRAPARRRRKASKPGPGGITEGRGLGGAELYQPSLGVVAFPVDKAGHPSSGHPSAGVTAALRGLCSCVLSCCPEALPVLPWAPGWRPPEARGPSHGATSGAALGPQACAEGTRGLSWWRLLCFVLLVRFASTAAADGTGLAPVDGRAAGAACGPRSGPRGPPPPAPSRHVLLAAALSSAAAALCAPEGGVSLFQTEPHSGVTLAGTNTTRRWGFSQGRKCRTISFHFSFLKISFFF